MLDQLQPWPLRGRRRPRRVAVRARLPPGRSRQVARHLHRRLRMHQRRPDFRPLQLFRLALQIRQCADAAAAGPASASGVLVRIFQRGRLDLGRRARHAFPEPGPDRVRQGQYRRLPRGAHQARRRRPTQGGIPRRRRDRRAAQRRRRRYRCGSQAHRRTRHGAPRRARSPSPRARGEGALRASEPQMSAHSLTPRRAERPPHPARKSAPTSPRTRGEVCGTTAQTPRRTPRRSARDSRWRDGWSRSPFRPPPSARRTSPRSCRPCVRKRYGSRCSSRSHW